MAKVWMWLGLSFAAFGAMFFVSVLALVVLVRPVQPPIRYTPAHQQTADVAATPAVVVEPVTTPTVPITQDEPKVVSQPLTQPTTPNAPQTAFREVQLPIQKGDVRVKGYVKKDGTVVAPYVRHQ